AERRHEGEPPHPRQAAPPAGRGSLVERGLYRRAQGPRANTFRIGRPPPEPSTQAPEPNPSSSRTTPKFHARSRTARPIQLAIVRTADYVLFVGVDWARVSRHILTVRAGECRRTPGQQCRSARMAAVEAARCQADCLAAMLPR